MNQLKHFFLLLLLLTFNEFINLNLHAMENRKIEDDEKKRDTKCWPYLSFPDLFKMQLQEQIVEDTQHDNLMYILDKCALPLSKTLYPK